MEAQQIVLEYMRLILEGLTVLAWPAVVIFILSRYENYFAILLRRISEESEEFSSNWFSVKFRKDLQEIRDAIPPENTDLQKKVERMQQQLSVQQFIELAPQFFSAPLTMRIHLAEIIESLAPFLELPIILEFASSSERGERAASGIALKQHILTNQNIEKQPRVLEALKRGISDQYSRVRYRYIEAIGASKTLTESFAQDLENILKQDKSPGVREEARRVLETIRKK